MCVNIRYSFIEAIPLCVNTISIYIYVIHNNNIIHTIKCYKFNGYMFRSPLRPSSGQLLQIVRLQCAYNMGSHNANIIFIYGLKSIYKKMMYTLWDPIL